MKTKEKTSRQSGSTSIPIAQSSLKEVVETSQKYEKKRKEVERVNRRSYLLSC